MEEQAGLQAGTLPVPAAGPDPGGVTAAQAGSRARQKCHCLWQCLRPPGQHSEAGHGNGAPVGGRALKNGNWSALLGDILRVQTVEGEITGN